MEIRKRFKVNGERLYTFVELPYTARVKVLEADIAFTHKYGFSLHGLEDRSLYYECGKIACNR